MNSLVFVLAAIFMVSYAANDCRTVSPCVFTTSAGTFDLTSFNKKVPVPTTDGEFKFNPCKGFTCGNASSLVCHAKQNLTLINESVKPNCMAANDTISLHYTQAKVQVKVMMECSNEMNTSFEYDAKKSDNETYIFMLTSHQGCAIAVTTATTMTTNGTTMPSNMTTMPSNMTTMPSNMTTMPSNMTTMPSNMTTMPSNMTTMPSNMTTHHMTTVPSNMTTVPSNMTTVPSNMTTVTTPSLETTTLGATTTVTSFTLVLSMASAVFLVSRAMQD